jgi:uncharacterized protein
MANPFPYQRPVLPAQVIDRDAETETLLDWCRDGMLVRLDAPRRYGKTSLVRRVFHEAAKGGTVGILCDLKGVLTLSDVITRLGRSYAQLQGSAAKLLRPTLTAIEAEFSVSFMGAGVKSSLAGRPANEEAALFALLDLPQRFAGKGWQAVIVCFDEFQDVLAVPAADDKLRAAIQHHSDGCAYIFAGSEPRLMNSLFSDKRRAFWNQAEPLELGPLAPADVAGYVTAQFAADGRDVGPVLRLVLSTAQGHPQRTMFLCSKLWERSQPGEPVTIEAWQAALDAAKLQEEHALDAEWRNLTGSAQRVLRAVTLNGGRPFQKQAAEAVGVPIGSVDRVSDALVGAYILRQTGKGEFAFVDPMLELYVRDLAGSSLPEAEQDDDRPTGRRGGARRPPPPSGGTAP